MTGRVRVALLDSGVFTGNPHIRRPLEGGITILHQGECSGFEDVLGHGTAVCAVLQNLAPEAELYAVKIFDRRLSTTVSVVLRGIEWCIENEMDIINLSLGTTNTDHVPQFLEVIEKVRNIKGILIAAYELGGAAMFPGSLPGVVGVVEDPFCPREAYRVLDNSFSRVAACPFPLDIAGVPRERNLHGVSFSVSHVSAQLARTWSDVSPEATPMQRVREAERLIIAETSSLSGQPK